MEGSQSSVSSIQLPYSHNTWTQKLSLDIWKSWRNLQNYAREWCALTIGDVFITVIIQDDLVVHEKWAEEYGSTFKYYGILNVRE